MPGKPDKPHRIRVRTRDGKPRVGKELNILKSNQLGMPHLDFHGEGQEFLICAAAAKHIEQVRAKLDGAGLDEIPDGVTMIPTNAPATNAPATNAPSLPGKPYGFVALPDELTTEPPVWHDGTSSAGRLSGEVRFEIETLTPLLVGWEGGQVGDNDGDWPPPTSVDGAGTLAEEKTVLCPLRAPWGARPVIIPGDSLKGLLRHELGALLGAPMERVAERSYSYRPNSMFAKDSQLIPRIARVPASGVVMKPLAASDGPQVRVPTKLELLPAHLQFDSPRQQQKHNRGPLIDDYYRFDDSDGAPYRGGQGAGQRLNSTRKLHRRLTARPDAPHKEALVPEEVQEGYLATLRHLTDLDHGHFSPRHPDVPNQVKDTDARSRILKAANSVVFQPGDLIWVEWDTVKRCIVSLGWHYYYRWAYTSSVRKKAGTLERYQLVPLDDERAHDSDGGPVGLSPVRRLFGYTGDNDGSAGIGKDDHSQLMGRVSVNAGLEVVGDADNEDTRFLGPTFLKELGMPRPSAVEHYLKQPYHPNSRPSDRATLVTYGDAAGYDSPGELAGRKFYLDRKDAYTGEPWKDDSEDNRKNNRSTLALEASKPKRKFRFTVRFRDLDSTELAAVLVALCPHQFRAVLGGSHTDGYCSKLGYARPLGWGAVRIEAKALMLLDTAEDRPTLKRTEAGLDKWVQRNHVQSAMQKEWLDVHRHKHPDAADYPRKDGEIYTFHTSLRAEHSHERRYRKEGS